MTETILARPLRRADLGGIPFPHGLTPLMIDLLRHHLLTDASRLRHFWREHGTRATLVWIGSLDSPATIQFAKYLLFGTATAFVHLALFTWLSHTFFPAHDYLQPGGIDDALKQRNALVSNFIAFPVAAIVNYLFNIAFVFTSGRHSRLREILLFLLISLAGFAAGLLCGPFLIAHSLNPWIAQAGLMASAALFNYLCRKFLIFLR